MSNITFCGVECDIHKCNYYGNGDDIGLLLTNKEGVFYGDVTVQRSMLDVSIPKGYIAVKNFDEYEGMVGCLVTAGVVSPPINSLFGKLYVCRLLV